MLRPKESNAGSQANAEEEECHSLFGMAEQRQEHVEVDEARRMGSRMRKSCQCHETDGIEKTLSMSLNVWSLETLDQTYQSALSSPCCHLNLLDKYLVGKNDPADFSKAWRKKFSKHPSWCDADMCLQQINAGNALLFHLGEFVQQWPKSIVVVGLVLLTVCSFGLKDAIIETDLVQLWVERGGRLDEEMNFLSNAKSDYRKRAKRSEVRQSTQNSPIVAQTNQTAPFTRSEGNAVELPTENTFGGGFQVVIQTPEVPGENILTREGLQRHVAILEQISKYSVQMFGEEWHLSDICFKPPPPASSKDLLAQFMEDIMSQIIPCVWITPIDCFWEGSKPLGPFPEYDLGPFSQFVPSVPNGKLSWKSLNPEALLNATRSLVDVGMIGELFERAGIGMAYQDRPCIDPLDPDCPATAPNYFNRCGAFEHFSKWNAKLPTQHRVVLRPPDIVGKKTISKRESTNSTTTSSKAAADGADAADYYDNDDESATTTTEAPAQRAQREKQRDCELYGRPFIEWLSANRERIHEFIDSAEGDNRRLLPVYPDYGQVLTGGCRGFGKRIMSWPEDLIVGGIRRDAQGFNIRHAEAFQTVFLVASGADVHQRLTRSKNHRLEKLGATFTQAHAGAIIAAWQRNFTRNIYDHVLNKPDQSVRVVHPLASTSIQDMLEQFSEFQFFVIFIGYVLMIIYAGWSQLHWDGWWFSAKSSCLLAIIGVLVITLASVAGLGLSTVMHIHFNAATTQIVPFLTLGLGIDDMFLLLHNYNDVLEAVRQKEVAVLLKETGMSVLLTSINNILAFLTGCMLPIPALRSFCGQVAILLTSNVICIILIFPAFIALDLQRRKAGHRDMSIAFFCCCCSSSSNCFTGANKGSGGIGTEKGSDKCAKMMESGGIRKRKLEECSSRNQLVKTDSTVTTYSSEIDLQQMSAVVFGPPLSGQLMMSGSGGTSSSSPSSTPKKSASLISSASSTTKWYTLSGFLHGYYIPMLRRPIAKTIVLLLCAAMFLFGCFGLYYSGIGLELADVLPEHTAPAAFLKGPRVDYAQQQHKLEQLRRDIAKSNFVIKVDGEPEQWWMMFMRTWLQLLQSSLDRAANVGIWPSDDLKKTAADALARNFTLSDDFFLARKLLCSVGHRFNCTETHGTKLIEDGRINPKGFYNYLTAWFYQDNMMYYVSQAAFFPTPPPWHFSATDESAVPPADALLYSQIPFYMNGLTDTPAIVEMIKEIRAILPEADLLSNIRNFAVLLVISLIIFNPWAAVMVAIIVVTMTVELAGFMGVFGVKMNPISAVTLITAVGIGVEFTAHVVLAFLTSLGTRDERMVACLEHMFIPVIHGGLSTLLGIVMLAFSEFDFVIKYFFVVMTALVIIGLINGLALLPVLLSLIGPPCEITPVDGSNLLPCPASARYRPEDSPNCFNPSSAHEQQPDEQKKRRGCKRMLAVDDSSSSSSAEDGGDAPTFGNGSAAAVDESERSLQQNTQEGRHGQHNYHESLSTLYEASGEEREQQRSTPPKSSNSSAGEEDAIGKTNRTFSSLAAKAIVKQRF
uniref:SSD domain-containing protein n=1 Tax=Globodera rostochiensis TaxID=31243 RepID=A0A914I5P3_GLORO